MLILTHERRPVGDRPPLSTPPLATIHIYPGPILKLIGRPRLVTLLFHIFLQSEIFLEPFDMTNCQSQKFFTDILARIGKLYSSPQLSTISCLSYYLQPVLVASIISVEFSPRNCVCQCSIFSITFTCYNPRGVHRRTGI